MNNNIVVIENFVSPELASRIEGAFLNSDFPWFYNDSTIGAYAQMDGDIYSVDSPQFTHQFVRDGVRTSAATSTPEVLACMLAELIGADFGRTIRIKANLNIQNRRGNDAHMPIHVDFDPVCPFVTAIYYVNDCDGDTVFFDDEMREIRRVAPRKGTLAYFDGRIKHAGTTPINSNVRCVININIQTDRWLRDSMHTSH